MTATRARCLRSGLAGAGPCRSGFGRARNRVRMHRLHGPAAPAPRRAGIPVRSAPRSRARAIRLVTILVFRRPGLGGPPERPSDLPKSAERGLPARTGTSSAARAQDHAREFGHGAACARRRCVTRFAPHCRRRSGVPRGRARRPPGRARRAAIAAIIASTAAAAGPPCTSSIDGACGSSKASIRWRCRTKAVSGLWGPILGLEHQADAILHDRLGHGRASGCARNRGRAMQCRDGGMGQQALRRALPAAVDQKRAAVPAETIVEIGVEGRGAGPEELPQAPLDRGRSPSASPTGCGHGHQGSDPAGQYRPAVPGTGATGRPPGRAAAGGGIPGSAGRCCGRCCADCRRYPWQRRGAKPRASAFGGPAGARPARNRS
jgi:hypothetical protein